MDVLKASEGHFGASLFISKLYPNYQYYLKLIGLKQIKSKDQAVQTPALSIIKSMTTMN